MYALYCVLVQLLMLLCCAASTLSGTASGRVHRAESGPPRGAQWRRHPGHADAAAAALRRVVLHQPQHQVRPLRQVPRRARPRLHGSLPAARRTSRPLRPQTYGIFVSSYTSVVGLFQFQDSKNFTDVFCFRIFIEVSVSDLIENADEDLFHKMRRPQLCLHHLLPLSVWWIN